MALARGQDILAAIVDQLDRLTRLPRHQRGERRDERWHVFLPTERASGCGLHNAYLGQGKPEDTCDCSLNVERALHRSVNGHRPVLIGDGDRPLRLEIGVLLITGAILAFNDHVRLSEALFHVSFTQAHVVEYVHPLFYNLRHGDGRSVIGKSGNRIGDDWQVLVIDLCQLRCALG